MKLASICYTALKASGVSLLARRLQRGGLILCYHNVVAGAAATPGEGLGLHMPLSTFERQMRWLAATYAVLPLGEIVGRLSRGGSLRGMVAITFDDGYSGVFDHAWPVLRDLSMPATVFIVAQAPERDEDFWWDYPEVLRAYTPTRRRHWLTALRGDSATIVESLAPGRSPTRPPPCRRPAPWKAITDAVGSGLGLGVHSATHRSLPTLDDVELRQEVVESRDAITRRTGRTPEFFAYPYGHWNDRVRRAVRSAGYRGAVTVDYGHNAATADPWALRRVNVPAGIEDAAFQAWAAGLNVRPRDGA